MSETFSSDRLAMRPQGVGDAEALHEAYRDETVMRYWSSAPHADLEETRAYLAPRDDKADWRGWTITLAGTGEVTGTLAAGARRAGVSEIGYMILRRHWGHGYAREAVSRLLDLLFVEEGHRRVMADTDPDNAGSNALLTRLGFTLEGRLRGEWETHIGVRDSFIWGMLAEEWTNR